MSYHMVNKTHLRFPEKLSMSQENPVAEPRSSRWEPPKKIKRFSLGTVPLFPGDHKTNYCAPSSDFFFFFFCRLVQTRDTNTDSEEREIHSLEDVQLLGVPCDSPVLSGRTAGWSSSFRIFPWGAVERGAGQQWEGEAKFLRLTRS